MNSSWTFLAPAAEAPVEPGPPPTFSVVVAAYQAAGFVGEAVKSALEQTHPPLEVVVSDDGSTDDLAAALEPWRERIVLLRNEHRGEAAAKNAGFRAACGDFIVLLDADDVYLPERLKALAALGAARPDLDVLTTDAYLEVEGQVVRRCYSQAWPFPVRDQRREILLRNFVFGHAAVRRERILEVGGFDEAMASAADWDCWIRLLLGGSRAGLVPEPLSRYRLREEGMSARRSEHIRGYITALEKALGRPDLTSDERQAAAGFLAHRRRDLALADAHTALLEGRADVRRRAAAIALDSSFPAATRLKSALVAAAPPVARRLLRGRRDRTWEAAGGILVPRRQRVPPESRS
jgi:glycosyltransferase involved in cell wall biosynthesis